MTGDPLTAMPTAGIPLGDVLADSGFAHREAAAWAVPLRAAGVQLVQDLHPPRHLDHRHMFTLSPIHPAGSG